MAYHHRNVGGRPYNPFRGGRGTNLTYTDPRYKGLAGSGAHRGGLLRCLTPWPCMIILLALSYLSYSSFIAPAPMTTSLTSLKDGNREDKFKTPLLDRRDTASSQSSSHNYAAKSSSEELKTKESDGFESPERSNPDNENKEKKGVDDDQGDDMEPPMNKDYGYEPDERAGGDSAWDTERQRHQGLPPGGGSGDEGDRFEEEEPETMNEKMPVVVESFSEDTEESSKDQPWNDHEDSREDEEVATPGETPPGDDNDPEAPSREDPPPEDTIDSVDSKEALQGDHALQADNSKDLETGDKSKREEDTVRSETDKTLVQFTENENKTIEAEKLLDTNDLDVKVDAAKDSDSAGELSISPPEDASNQTVTTPLEDGKSGEEEMVNPPEQVEEKVKPPEQVEESAEESGTSPHEDPSEKNETAKSEDEKSGDQENVEPPEKVGESAEESGTSPEEDASEKNETAKSEDEKSGDQEKVKPPVKEEESVEESGTSLHEDASEKNVTAISEDGKSGDKEKVKLPEKVGESAEESGTRPEEDASEKNVTAKSEDGKSGDEEKVKPPEKGGESAEESGTSPQEGASEKKTQSNDKKGGDKKGKPKIGESAEQAGATPLDGVLNVTAAMEKASSDAAVVERVTSDGGIETKAKKKSGAKKTSSAEVDSSLNHTDTGNEISGPVAAKKQNAEAGVDHEDSKEELGKQDRPEPAAESPIDKAEKKGAPKKQTVNDINNVAANNSSVIDKSAKSGNPKKNSQAKNDPKKGIVNLPKVVKDLIKSKTGNAVAKDINTINNDATIPAVGSEKGTDTTKDGIKPSKDKKRGSRNEKKVDASALTDSAKDKADTGKKSGGKTPDKNAGNSKEGTEKKPVNSDVLQQDKEQLAKEGDAKAISADSKNKVNKKESNKKESKPFLRGASATVKKTSFR